MHEKLAQLRLRMARTYSRVLAAMSLAFVLSIQRNLIFGGPRWMTAPLAWLVLAVFTLLVVPSAPSVHLIGSHAEFLVCRGNHRCSYWLLAGISACRTPFHSVSACTGALSTSFCNGSAATCIDSCGKSDFALCGMRSHRN